MSSSCGGQKDCIRVRNYPSTNNSSSISIWWVFRSEQVGWVGTEPSASNISYCWVAFCMMESWPTVSACLITSSAPLWTDQWRDTKNSGLLVWWLMKLLTSPIYSHEESHKKWSYKYICSTWLTLVLTKITPWSLITWPSLPA
jgi:hypothetical protein